MLGALIGLSAASGAASYLGAQADRNAAAHQNRMAAAVNYAQQKEFAQQGIQWKVADAKAAGIHPLAALGASTASGGDTHQVGGAGGSAGGDLGRSLASMGQSASRALAASQTADQRALSQLTIANAKAELDGKTIENQIRQNQLNQMRATGPAFPSANDQHMISGQGDAMTGVRIMPSESVASEKGRPGIQAGMINQLQYTREADGQIGVAPSQQAKERIEDDIIAQPLWHLKNRLNPPPPDPKNYPIPEHLRKKGYKYWFWNPFKQVFVPSKNK